MESATADGFVTIETPNAEDAKKQATDFTLINAEGFKPFVLHEKRALVPIAMVNRAPHGSTCFNSLRQETDISPPS